jgi:DNA-binding beta-propeller fold protein YncE
MKIRACLAASIGLCLLLGGLATHAQAPSYKFDPDWPKLPLPNKWWMQGVTGLYVDSDDNIWVLNRPSNLSNTEDYAQLDPPTADCCVAPPAVIAFDIDGNVIQSWDTREGHGMMVDHDGFVWIGSDTVRKFTRDGRLVAALERVPENPVPEGKYPPETELIIGGLEEIRADEDAREVFVVDNYLNGRILVYDMDTLEFKRGWGAYGKPLSEISMDTSARYDPESPAAEDFLGHVTIGLSDDGLAYVDDRRGNIIQVLTTRGEYQKEFFLATATLQRGSTGGIAFSADPEQRYLIVPDIQNNTVRILNRNDGTVVATVGSPGDNGGQFHGLHMAAVDSRGNLYTGEVQNGERVQRFVLVD